MATINAEHMEAQNKTYRQRIAAKNLRRRLRREAKWKTELVDLREEVEGHRANAKALETKMLQPDLTPDVRYKLQSDFNDEIGFMVQAQGELDLHIVFLEQCGIVQGMDPEREGEYKLVWTEAK